MEATDALRKELVALAAIRDSLIKENEQVRSLLAGALRTCYLLTRRTAAATPAPRVRGWRAPGAWACLPSVEFCSERTRWGERALMSGPHSPGGA